MDQRLSLVTLGVDDLARARAFYEDGLGWRPADAPEGVVFYQLPGMAFALWSRSELAQDARTPVDGSFSGIALACNQRTEDDVDRVLAQAERAGGRILKPAERAPWGGYSGYFADPDGHVWEVAFNPGWPLAEDGTIRL
jgi:catechol 2,3-dioxygenase-like lactoylglutathione lyase family enzyme